MKKIYIILVISSGFLQLKSTPSDSLTVAFWNVENLFDLVDDPLKNDDEFALGGKKNVTKDIYDLKLKNCVEVLTDLNADIVGICEVENRFMMEELNRAYQDRDYKIVHYDSPDNRGIDCALFFDDRKFKVLTSEPITNSLTAGTPTRDILYVKGRFRNEILHLFINHWPSNYGGKEQAIPKRAETAQLLKKYVWEIIRSDHSAAILLMGDFNEDPSDANVKNLTRLNASFAWWSKLDNLMTRFVEKPGIGTYVYKGQDYILDQIIVSWSLFDHEGLDVDRSSIYILDMPKYRQQSGNYKHYPFRFWAGNKLLGGYSDHLAVKVSIIKQ